MLFLRCTFFFIVHDCHFAEIRRQTDGESPDGGSGEMSMKRQFDTGSAEMGLDISMKRQFDTGSGEMEPEKGIERQLDTGSGEPDLEGKKEEKADLGMCQSCCF